MARRARPARPAGCASAAGTTATGRVCSGPAGARPARPRSPGQSHATHRERALGPAAHDRRHALEHRPGGPCRQRTPESAGARHLWLFAAQKDRAAARARGTRARSAGLHLPGRSGAGGPGNHPHAATGRNRRWLELGAAGQRHHLERRPGGARQPGRAAARRAGDTQRRLAQTQWFDGQAGILNTPEELHATPSKERHWPSDRAGPAVA